MTNIRRALEATAGGGDKTYVEDVFNTDLYKGTGAGLGEDPGKAIQLELEKAAQDNEFLKSFIPAYKYSILARKFSLRPLSVIMLYCGLD